MADAPKDIAERFFFAAEIAREAGDVTLRYFRQANLQVDRKADSSPVTIADRSAEELLRSRIESKFCQDGILGEEFGETDGNSSYQWILDPIDGTKSFIHGVPLYTTLIAVLRDGEPLIGVIHAPATDEMVHAAVDVGCWYQPKSNAKATPTRVSTVTRLSESLLLTTEVASFTTHREPDALETFIKLQRAARLARTWGDGYGYLMVATGRAEVMIDPVVNLWDAAPLQTIIEEAGGNFTDWNGKATIHAGEALATNGRVDDEVLAITRGAGRAE
ncbi:MAG TPA: histidinol-phosphatase [Lacipirellulaceae bacterium]|jgi:histidinol phosphatase-like enzyme (inositol monophosphatase family)|nr:histidinol-phosphatase [Lacipirellulaceae bacterium]